MAYIKNADAVEALYGMGDVVGPIKRMNQHLQTANGQSVLDTVPAQPKKMQPVGQDVTLSKPSTTQPTRKSDFVGFSRFVSKPAIVVEPPKKPVDVVLTHPKSKPKRETKCEFILDEAEISDTDPASGDEVMAESGPNKYVVDNDFFVADHHSQSDFSPEEDEVKNSKKSITRKRKKQATRVESDAEEPAPAPAPADPTVPVPNVPTTIGGARMDESRLRETLRDVLRTFVGWWMATSSKMDASEPPNPYVTQLDSWTDAVYRGRVDPFNIAFVSVYKAYLTPEIDYERVKNDATYHSLSANALRGFDQLTKKGILPHEIFDIAFTTFHFQLLLNNQRFTQLVEAGVKHTRMHVRLRSTAVGSKDLWAGRMSVGKIAVLAQLIFCHHPLAVLQHHLKEYMRLHHDSLFDMVTLKLENSVVHDNRTCQTEVGMFLFHMKDPFLDFVDSLVAAMNESSAIANATAE